MRTTLFTLIVLLVLLPMQCSWGFASGGKYLEDEGATRFTVRAEVDQVKVLKASGESKPAEKGMFCKTPNCVCCHLTCVPLSPHSVVLLSRESADPPRMARTEQKPQYIVYPVERPNWTLAA